MWKGDNLLVNKIKLNYFFREFQLTKIFIFYVYECFACLWSQKRVLDALDLELQIIETPGECWVLNPSPLDSPAKVNLFLSGFG